VVEEIWEPEIKPWEKPIYGKRAIFEIPFFHSFRGLLECMKENVPNPEWPDPDKEPLPKPHIEQILKKPHNRSDKQPSQLFTVLTETDTPTDLPPAEDKPKEDAKGKAAPAKPGAKAEPVIEETKGPYYTSKITRWVLNPGQSQKLFVKFFSTKVGVYDSILNFEVLGSTKQFPLHVTGKCEFPSINNNIKNVFMDQKKSRPNHAPESYLSKVFILNEGLFDFGPILVGKDAEKRNSDDS
jgi:hypothetical protein